MLDQTDLLRQVQTLASLYGEQFKSLETRILAMEANEKERHNRFTEQMSSLKVMHETLMDMLSLLSKTTEDLQEVTVAFINLSEMIEEGQKPDTSLQSLQR